MGRGIGPEGLMHLSLGSLGDRSLRGKCTYTEYLGIDVYVLEADHLHCRQVSEELTCLSWGS